MAYKFQRGAFRASGSTVIEEGLTIDASGLTVTGSSNVQALTANSLNVDSVSLDSNILSGLSQLTASAISASTGQFGSITVPTLSSTNLDLAGYLAVEGATRLSGTVALGDAVGDVITVNGQITGSLFAINGGTINNTAIGGTTQAAGQFTTLSASSNLQVGTSVTASNGVLVNAGGVIVTAGGLAVNAGNLAVSNGNISGSGALQAGGQLTVAQSATLNGGLTITTGGATVSGSLNVSGSITVGSADGVVAAPTANVTSLQVTNIKAKDGTPAGSIANSTGVVTLASTVLTTTDINGGTIDGTTIGATTQSSVKATTLSASSNLQVGTSITASSGILVNAGGLTVSAGDSSLQKLTVNGDLIVLGTTFSASVGTLVIEDKQIVLADGAPNAAAAYGAGFFVSGANVEWTFKENGEGTAASSGHIFAASGSSGLIDIQAANIYGTLVGTMASPVTLVADAGTLATGVNYFADVVGASSVTLPGAPSVGDSVRVKAPSNCSTTNTITINRSGSHTIDAETFIVLESSFAAVEFVYVATNLWRIF